MLSYGGSVYSPFHLCFATSFNRFMDLYEVEIFLTFPHAVSSILLICVYKHIFWINNWFVSSAEIIAFVWIGLYVFLVNTILIFSSTDIAYFMYLIGASSKRKREAGKAS